jgi:Type I restriction modification DNA specificity domain
MRPFCFKNEQNNGVSAFVCLIDYIKPFDSELITVAVSGSVMEAFVQVKPFYTAYHVMVLTPKREMSLVEKLFYCLCIRRNKYRYSYGRQANKTLKDLLVPAEIPTWVYEQEIQTYSQVTKPHTDQRLEFSSREWGSFRYTDLFDIRKGKRVRNRELRSGQTPIVRPLNNSNGYAGWVDLKPNHEGNTITLNYNSQGGVGEAFYQPIPFFATDDVNILYPKFNLTPEIAMFLITLIRKERYRYNYGRKWHLERMRESVIKLPIDIDGEPDWKFIQSYIESLPYSAELKLI